MNSRHCLPALMMLLPALALQAERPSEIEYDASLIANAASGEWAPYMIGSWNDGRVTSASGAWLDLSATKRLDLSSRFSWSAGVEAMFGGGTKAPYERWNPGTSAFEEHREGQAPARLIQLWGEVKFRGVFAMAGMKSHSSLIVARGLSSGDITLSDNARPVPGVTVGFVDFQNIPFTRGWVQIEGRLTYGRMTDSRFKENRYNFFNDLIASDLMYTYKRCYFRTMPTQPVFVTVGMQAAGLFGGNTRYYSNGVLAGRIDRGFHVKDLWQMFFPMEGSGEGFYKGSSLGSWDFRADLRLKSGHRLAAYFEWPWEDGSGIGRRNGWDGLWGLEYRAPRESWVDAAVVEYLEFTNMSGPLHWAPGDHNNTTITGSATGGDNYWNNDVYGPWCNYGMSIGTPFVVSPLYNSDGHWQFAHNRARGFHAALEGRVAPQWRYKAMLSYQKAWGDGRRPQAVGLHDTSAMIEARWAQGDSKPWSADLRLALDAGNLRGNNFGAMLTVRYSGAIKIK